MKNNTTCLSSTTLCIFAICSFLFFSGCVNHKIEKQECEITWYNTTINLYFPSFDSNMDTNSLKYNYSIQVQFKNLLDDTLYLPNIAKRDIFHWPKLLYMDNSKLVEFLIDTSQSYYFHIKPNDSIIIGYDMGEIREMEYLKGELTACEEQLKRKIESFNLFFNSKLFYCGLNNYMIKKHNDYQEVFCQHCCY